MSREFQFEDAARNYFNQIRALTSSGDFSTLLEKYWLCALLGLVSGERARPDQTRGLVDNFAGSLDAHALENIALLFWRHARTEPGGTAANSESRVLNELALFFDAGSRTKLSASAVEALDRYAAGGFRLLYRELDPPTDLATFLIDYVEVLSSASRGEL